MSLTLNLSFTLPSQQEVDDFVHYLGYQDLVSDPATPGALMPNPQSKGAFAKIKLIAFIRESIKAKRVTEASQTTIKTQQAAADALVIS